MAGAEWRVFSTADDLENRRRSRWPSVAPVTDTNRGGCFYRGPFGPPNVAAAWCRPSRKALHARVALVSTAPQLVPLVKAPCMRPAMGGTLWSKWVCYFQPARGCCSLTHLLSRNSQDPCVVVFLTLRKRSSSNVSMDHIDVHSVRSVTQHVAPSHCYCAAAPPPPPPPGPHSLVTVTVFLSRQLVPVICTASSLFALFSPHLHAMFLF